MARRLVHVRYPEPLGETVVERLTEQEPAALWTAPLAGDERITSVLVEAEQTEEIMDCLKGLIDGTKGFVVTVLPVEASLPKPPEPEKQPEQAPEIGPKKRVSRRISREELTDDINDACKLSRVFFMMVFLATVVAAFGLLRSNVAVIIGAMVIAPLLGPNMALSLATTLADWKMAKRAFIANGAGSMFALALAIIVGLLFGANPEETEIIARTSVAPTDIAIALASGAAGALAFTTGAPATLVGVMVAVALLPPLATVGLMTSVGEWSAALGAVLLLAVNVVCVNLSGVAMFLIQGVRPRSWWEADKAKKYTRIAIVVWSGMLALLVVLILLAGGPDVAASP